MDYYSEQKDAERFWRYLLQQFPATARSSDILRGRDVEASVFFNVLEAAFTGTQCRLINHELMQYIAGWGRSMTEGRSEKGGPFGGPLKQNHFLNRAFEGFIQTLRVAIKAGEVKDRDGDMMYGCLQLPLWFVEKYQKEAEHEAAQRRKIRSGSRSHLYLV